MRFIFGPNRQDKHSQQIAQKTEASAGPVLAFATKEDAQWYIKQKREQLQTEAVLRAISVQVESQTISALDASNDQFDTWAKAQVPVHQKGILDELDGLWSIGQRRDFCAYLESQGLLPQTSPKVASDPSK
jgi:hypothetical protein